jgi:hypothetical protein
MAAAAHFSARVYGEIEGNPPFQNASGLSAFSRVKDHPAPQVNSFPTGGVNFWALPNGYQMGNGSYVYSVIEVQATGLNQHNPKYVSDQSAAALATLAG